MASRVTGTGAFANVSHRGSGFPVGHFSVPRSNIGDVVMAGLVARHGSGAGARDRERERGSSRLRSTSLPAEQPSYRTPAGPQEELDWLEELDKLRARVSTLEIAQRSHAHSIAKNSEKNELNNQRCEICILVQPITSIRLRY